jgi:hypothetical protein
MAIIFDANSFRVKMDQKEDTISFFCPIFTKIRPEAIQGYHAEQASGNLKPPVIPDFPQTDSSLRILKSK